MNWKNITETQYEQWAAIKRQDYQRGLVSPEIIAACESISGWSWDLKIHTSFLPFEEARTFIHTLALKNFKDWQAYCKSGKRPVGISTQPHKIYAGSGWVSWGDWFGNNNVHTKAFLPFEEARAFVRSLGLKGAKEWCAYRKNRPSNIPSAPNTQYAGKGWVNWGDWFGTSNVHTKTFLPFEEARTFVRALHLKNYADWCLYRKSSNRPHDIPSSPNGYYKNKGWVGYKDWLGTTGA
jgi:hypothetical protein